MTRWEGARDDSTSNLDHFSAVRVCWRRDCLSDCLRRAGPLEAQVNTDHGPQWPGTYAPCDCGVMVHSSRWYEHTRYECAATDGGCWYCGFKGEVKTWLENGRDEHYCPECHTIYTDRDLLVREGQRFS